LVWAFGIVGFFAAVGSGGGYWLYQRPPAVPPRTKHAPSAVLSMHAVGMTFRDCEGVCPEMIVVPPGSFQMGFAQY